MPVVSAFISVRTISPSAVSLRCNKEEDSYASMVVGSSESRCGETLQPELSKNAAHRTHVFPNESVPCDQLMTDQYGRIGLGRPVAFPSPEARP